MPHNPELDLVLERVIDVAPERDWYDAMGFTLGWSAALQQMVEAIRGEVREQPARRIDGRSGSLVSAAAPLAGADLALRLSRSSHLREPARPNSRLMQRALATGKVPL
jgi:hypothetical protein